MKNKTMTVSILLLMLASLSGCATRSLGVLPYAEFDKIKKKYPEKRANVALIRNCDMSAALNLSFIEELNKMKSQNPEMTGLSDFEFFGDMCFNVRGIIEKGN